MPVAKKIAHNAPNSSSVRVPPNASAPPALSSYAYIWDQFSPIGQHLGISERQMFITLSVLFHLLLAALVAIYIAVIEPLTHLLLRNRRSRWKVQMTFIRLITKLTVVVYERTFCIEVLGDASIDPRRLAVVTSNHQTVFDYLTILFCASRCGIDNSVLFFVWKHCVRLPSVPVLYNMWWKPSNWRLTDPVPPEFFSPLLDAPSRESGGKWLVVFPEVTSWQIKYMIEHRTECTDAGCPPLQNLLYPRYNAMAQSIKSLRDLELAQMCDITIVYVSPSHRIGIPTWTDLVTSQRQWRLRIEIRSRGLSGLPKKEKHLVRWFEKEWYAKDHRISQLNQQLAAERAPRRADPLSLPK